MAELESVSYDQYKNIPSFEDLNQKVKIVFSSECYQNIIQMGINAMNQEREHGRFFVGRRISDEPEVIYFDYNTSEFEPADGPMGKEKAVIPSQSNYDELNKKIRDCELKGIKPVVLHFHSHPRDGIYQSFSDQDLQTYAKMQAQNSDCINLGMLGFPINQTSNTLGMCIVYPTNAQVVNGIGTADFVRCEDISFTSGNEIYKVGGFEKRYAVGLFKQSLNMGIVKQYLTLPHNAKVCAEGFDPNTGNPIKPTHVGYTDTSGNLYFTEEGLSLRTKINEIETTEIQK